MDKTASGRRDPMYGEGDSEDGGPADRLNRWIYSVGVKLGVTMFDMQCHIKNSPDIQQQKGPYSDAIGRGFCLYVYALLITPTIYQWSRSWSAWLTPNLPGVFRYDLMTKMPPFDYGIYGPSLTLAASLLLATQLSANFFVGRPEPGRTLGQAHTAIVLLITGNAFQAGDQYENVLSPPAGEPILPGDWVIEAMYIFFENLGTLFPYLTAPIIAAWIGAAYLYIVVYQGDDQTKITSDRWNRADAAHSSVENESE